MGISRTTRNKGKSKAVRSRRRDPFDIKRDTIRLDSRRVRRLGHRYGLGQHGGRKAEQRRLSGLFGLNVTGTTHESEHTIGYEPLARALTSKRGKSSEARSLENRAPAYQEVKAFHRSHIGTGTHASRDASGFNSQEYRDSQRALVESGDVSSALQLNQLGYAFDPAFQRARGPAIEAADESYGSMVENLGSVPLSDPSGERQIPVDPLQRAESHLARRAARTGKWPSAEQIAEVKRRFGA